MIVFPNAKINIGLRILRRRPDGYHDLDSVFLPIGWSDVLEIIPSKTKTTFTLTGSDLDGCPSEKNLVMKALECLEEYLGKSLPPVEIHLHKVIPSGAGLGGGSSDASFALVAINELFSLGLSKVQLAEVAKKVGADCPFFIYNQPMHVEGIGDKLTPVEVANLKGFQLVVAKPKSASVPTRQAYSGVTPCELTNSESLLSELSKFPSEWMKNGIVVNDFEKSIFPLRPEIEAVKELLLSLGAEYSAMSGSGAAVFGIFKSAKMAEHAMSECADCDSWCGSLLMGDYD